MRRWSYQHYTPSGVSKQQAAILGSVLIWRGARIVPNPQRLDGAEMLRVGTARAPLACLKFKSGHYPARQRERHAWAGRAHTTKIINELVALFGCHRKAAIRAAIPSPH